MDECLDPHARSLHVVRWLRADGRVVKHRYFSRASDAVNFRDKLAGYDIPAKIYATRVEEWRELP